MPRVLRIINRFNLGGPTFNASYLTAYMAPEFETLLIGGSPLEDEAHSGFIPESLGIRYIEIPEMSRSVNPMNDLKAWLRIRKIIREFKPDIVHTHASKAGALGRTAAMSCGVKTIVHTYHGHVFSGYFPARKSKIVQAIERFLNKRTHAIITISDKQFREITEEFHVAPPEKTYVIPLGLDLQKFGTNIPEKRKSFREKYGIKPDEIAVGIIGRIVPIKNHSMFTRVICDAQNNSKYRIVPVIIGDGEDRQTQEKLFENIRDKNQPKPVFTSWCKDVDVALAGLDIVALTSFNEGTPVSLIEAQAASRPVITTNAGGVKDCVEDGRSGFIIENFDEQKFSETITMLAEDEAKRNKMGAAGQKFANENFNYHQLVNNMKALYNKLLRR